MKSDIFKSCLETYKTIQDTRDKNNYFPLRNTFRLYIDGSHIYPNNEEGFEHYKRNCRYIKENINDNKKLLALAINEFISMAEVEFNLSSTTIRDTVKKVFNAQELEDFNNELIDDLKDLVRY